MADEAVMDAAVETAPLETSTEVEETTEQPTGLETPETQETPQDSQVPEKPLIDGGKLSAEAKATLNKLKVENPALARAIQRALYKESEYAQKLPGGLKELQELRGTVEQLGGPNGIQEIQAEVNGFREFDKQYTAADPKAIEFMTSDPAGQDAFVKLMPAALQKYEELHPEGFQNYMAQVISGTVASYGIPLALERLGDFIADNPKAMEQWNKLSGFVKTMGDLSRKQVEIPKRAQAAPDNDRMQFEQERQTFEREKWKNETASEQSQVFQAEWARLANGRKLSDTQSEAVKELFESRLNRAINGKHAETLQRYFDAKDKQGFMRYASTISKTEVPKALREAFDAVIPAKPGPHPGAMPVKNGAPPARGVAVAQGFVQVSKQPSTSEIDLRNDFNTTANFQAGKAVLKDGRRVQWSRT